MEKVNTVLPRETLSGEALIEQLANKNLAVILKPEIDCVILGSLITSDKIFVNPEIVLG